MTAIIRSLTSVEDFGLAIQVQRRAWGLADLEIVPVHMFSVAAKTGGQILGAFSDDDELIGFSLAFLAREGSSGPCHLFSHMVAVVPEYQGHSIGFQIKQAQKTDALARGFAFMRWIYDPLLAKNANLNINKLGGRISKFLPNEYGVVQSELYGELPTDRYMVEWNFCGEAPLQFPAHVPSVLAANVASPTIAPQVLNARPARFVLPIPLDHAELRTSNQALAVRWQHVVREVSAHTLGAEYHISNFRIDKAAGLGEYLFVRNAA